MHSYHDRQGHLGITKVWPDIRRRYWWPMARRDVREYVRLCRPCRQVKVPRHHTGQAQMTNNGKSPWSVVSFDVHDMGIESGGYTKVLSFADHFSRGILALPLSTTATSEDVADIIVNYLIRFYGKPEAIRSDRGSILISEVIKKLYEKYGIVMEAATAYHHQSVGLVERWHSTLQALVKTHRVATVDPDCYVRST